LPSAASLSSNLFAGSAIGSPFKQSRFSSPLSRPSLCLPFYLHIPILTGSLLFVWGGSVGGYYTLGMLNVGQCFKGSDLTAASSMFVMAHTAGMVVGPLFCSLSMQVAGPFGLLALFAIAPVFFIFLVLRRESAATVGGNRI